MTSPDSHYAGSSAGARERAIPDDPGRDGSRTILPAHGAPIQYSKSKSTLESQSQIHGQKRRMQWSGAPVHGVLTVILTVTLKSGFARGSPVSSQTSSS